MAENTSETGTHKAGLFDIRFVIGALMGLYGVILLITGFFTSDKQLDRADGFNVNIVGGIAMIVTARALRALGTAAADRGARARGTAGRPLPALGSTS